MSWFGGWSSPVGWPALESAGLATKLHRMRLLRLLGLLAFALSFAAGPLRVESFAAPSAAAASSTDLVSISSRRESLPAPVHDEATCAFCQAALFPPCVGHAPAILPEISARVCRIVLTPDEQILHVVSHRPVSSRAPPTLSFA
jgi:hypothetical protein